MQDSFNILLVDDDPTVIGVLGTILQEFGRLRFATSGQDALRMARQSVPDLILLDIEMPRLGGLEVLKAIRAQARRQRPLVIMMTSHREPAWREACLAAGADHFLLKDGEIERLLQILPAYAAQHRAPVGKVTTRHQKLTTVGLP